MQSLWVLRSWFVLGVPSGKMQALLRSLWVSSPPKHRGEAAIKEINPFPTDKSGAQLHWELGAQAHPPRAPQKSRTSSLAQSPSPCRPTHQEDPPYPPHGFHCLQCPPSHRYHLHLVCAVVMKQRCCKTCFDCIDRGYGAVKAAGMPGSQLVKDREERREAEGG